MVQILFPRFFDFQNIGHWLCPKILEQEKGLYFGTESIDKKGNVKAVVIAVNTAENYNHVLTVSIPAKVIASKQGTVEANLYPYIPTQNIRTLFGTYGKSNPKTYVSKWNK